MSGVPHAVDVGASLQLTPHLPQLVVRIWLPKRCLAAACQEIKGHVQVVKMELAVLNTIAGKVKPAKAMGPEAQCSKHPPSTSLLLRRAAAGCVVDLV